MLEQEQYVYIMSTPSFFDEIFKISWTIEEPTLNLDTLYVRDNSIPFGVEYVIITPDGSKLEKLIHKHIETYRVDTTKDFFEISTDKLIKILVNDLMLILTPITEFLLSPIEKKNYRELKRKINGIRLLYEDLKIDTHDFFSKFKREKTEIIMKKTNNKIISFHKIDYETKPFNFIGFDVYDELYIKCQYDIIMKDINNYEEILNDITNNYKEIKERIGHKVFVDDTEQFKEMVSKTQKLLSKLKSKYLWNV